MAILRSAVLPLLALFALVACGDAQVAEAPSARDRARADRLYQDALGFVEAGQDGEAMGYLAEALAIDPELEEAHRARVTIGPRAGVFGAVIESARWLSERYPDETEALWALAQAGLNSGDFEATRVALDELRRNVGASAPLEVMQARMYLELGDYERAERHAEQALELSAAQPDARLIIGLVHEDREDFERAIDAYRSVIVVDPGHLGARDRLAISLRRAGRRKESNRHREIHTALTRAMPGGYRQLPAEERIESFGALVELLPEWDLGYQELARAFLQAGRYRKADAALETALRLRPSPQSHELMARVREALGDADGARRHGELAGVPWENVAE